MEKFSPIQKADMEQNRALSDAELVKKEGAKFEPDSKGEPVLKVTEAQIQNIKEERDLAEDSKENYLSSRGTLEQGVIDLAIAELKNKVETCINGNVEVHKDFGVYSCSFANSDVSKLANFLEGFAKPTGGILLDKERRNKLKSLVEKIRKSQNEIELATEETLEILRDKRTEAYKDAPAY